MVSGEEKQQRFRIRPYVVYVGSTHPGGSRLQGSLDLRFHRTQEGEKGGELGPSRRSLEGRRLDSDRQPKDSALLLHGIELYPRPAQGTGHH